MTHGHHGGWRSRSSLACVVCILSPMVVVGPASPNPAAVDFAAQSAPPDTDTRQGAPSSPTAQPQRDALARIQDAAEAALARSKPSNIGTWAGPLRYSDAAWSRVTEGIRTSPSARAILASLQPAVESALALDPSLYIRPRTFQEIPVAQLDARFRLAGANGEVYALASVDCQQSDLLRSQGMLLAVYASVTGRQDCLEKVLDMLRAFRAHSPLQRPGWTAYSPEAKLAPGGDGVWLATAWGLQGLVEILSMLGDRVPPDLRADMHALIVAEVERIVTDWRDQRPWYVRSRECQSNQWIEPSAALIMACLYLQDTRLLSAYELGIRNLSCALDANGPDGAFIEGVSYAAMSTGAMFHAIELARASGDSRLTQHPFTTRAADWWCHMMLPGKQFVNCNDSRMSAIPPWAVRTPLPAMLSAAEASGTSAMSRLAHRFPGGDATLTGLRFAVLAEPLRTNPFTELPTFAHFPSQQLAVWRSGWEAPGASSKATSIWIRGGSPLDSHSHRDQGQLSVQSGDRPILIDCGTPDYATANLDRDYADAAGHNVCQVGELRPRNTPANAPLLVHSLGAEGGSIEIDARAAFPATTRCVRKIQWDKLPEILITDELALQDAAKPGAELFRFHTGSAGPISIAGSGTTWSAHWDGASLQIKSDIPIELGQSEWPDAVLAGSKHRVIHVKAHDLIRQLRLESRLQIVESSDSPD